MEKETKKIANNSLNDVSGGSKDREIDSYDVPKAVNLLISSRSDEPQRKGNYLDENGVYHITCINCGKELKSFKPAKGSAYAVGPQVCDDCQKNVSKTEAN